MHLGGRFLLLLSEPRQSAQDCPGSTTGAAAASSSHLGTFDKSIVARRRVMHAITNVARCWRRGITRALMVVRPSMWSPTRTDGVNRTGPTT